MSVKVIQINLNRSWYAFDLLKQRIFENRTGLAIISEPPTNVVETNRWFVSTDKLSAILWNVENSEGCICRKIKSSNGFVIVKYGEIYVISCYISPNVSTMIFEDILEDINGCIRTLPGPFVVCGDFNAKSAFWGSPDTNRRGDLLERWAASFDFRLLNWAGVHTCVRAQGSSVIDLTWVSSHILERITGWIVRNDLESLSDHLYVDFNILPIYKKANYFMHKRWNFKKMDIELFNSSLEFLVGTGIPGDALRSPELYSDWLVGIMRESCNVSTPKVSTVNGGRSAYWWSERISDLRTAAIAARRRLTRSRRRRHPVEEIRAYKAARRELRRAIKKAKNSSWKELIASIDRDPWGLPYKLVMGKLRRSNPALSETIEKEVLYRLLETLFPDNIKSGRALENTPVIWHEDFDVDIGEIYGLLKKRPSKNTAPGPDNIKMIVWRRVPRVIMDQVAGLFTLCLREGIFPRAWKRALLVLIPKGPFGLSDDIKARPICLLDELGKMFERIIADRLNQWLDGNPQSQLSDYQFGFRKNRSTVDALIYVRDFVKGVVDEGGVAIAVSLDIANAFNSIPWNVILSVMEERIFPAYLRRIVGDYLSNRYIVFKTIEGTLEEKPVRAGVPQGSVLGPLLWNLAFDSVLRLRLEEGCRIICYADDTLVVSTSNRVFGAVVSANIQIARVVRHISELGLTVSESKTEAVLFSKKRLNNMPSVRVGTSNIFTGESMKYLGVKIDRLWDFRDHFKYVESKLHKVSRALNRLMPNLRGPGEGKRRLYASVMTSVLTYAAPVWGSALASSPDYIIRPLRGLQRTVAIRVISAYRTVSFDAATLLARLPPWTLEVALRRRVYKRIAEAKRMGIFDRQEDNNIRREESILLIRQWEALLSRPCVWGQRTINAVLPHIHRWIDRRHGEITFHASQILTGHGSFGHFLWRIGKRDSTRCFHCQGDDDTLEHTLSDCPVWDNPRSDLRDELGLVPLQQITLDLIIDKILERKTHWFAFINFCSFVLRMKEEEERRLERPSPSPSLSVHSSTE